jgi:hypothetical protein
MCAAPPSNCPIDSTICTADASRALGGHYSEEYLRGDAEMDHEQRKRPVCTAQQAHDWRWHLNDLPLAIARLQR